MHRMRARYDLFVHPIKTVRGLSYSCASSIYDRWYGIETGKHDVRQTCVTDDFHPYDPTEPKYLRWALRNLPINPRKYSFVDFGSGKGRVLIAAASQPFIQVIGVEYQNELHRIALANIHTAKRMKCARVDSICLDARDLSIPSSPCICYFYNPFKGQIMDKVLSNIRESFANSPRPMFLIYVNPVLHEVCLRQPGLRLFKRGNWCNLYMWSADL